MEKIRKALPPRLFQLWYLYEKPFPIEWGRLPSSKKQIESRENGIYYYSKEELRSILYHEQNKKCGYCNQFIRNDESSPIEHLKSRTDYPKKIFDYFNLILSCDGNVKRKTDLQVHCDCLKDKNKIQVFPTNKKCEFIFVYDEFGNIYSKTEQGKEVIRVLGLNCPFLKNRREEILLDLVYNNQLQKRTSDQYKQSYLEIVGDDNTEFKNQILNVLLSFMDEKDRRQCMHKAYKIGIRKELSVLGIKIIGYIPYKILDICVKIKQKNTNYAM